LSYNIYLYGEYINSRFELWDLSAELTGEYPLLFASAPNSLDYLDVYKEFRIKNLDTANHTYKVQIIPNNYNLTDTFITNYFKVGNFNGTSWVKSSASTGYTTPAVTAGEFSETLRVYADFTIAQNPANGYHGFVVKVTELT
jgi:hypothetical protein